MTPKAALYNGIADQAAGNAAVAANTEHKAELLKYFGRKQHAYTLLIRAIMRRIVRVTSHTRAHRKAAAREKQADKSSHFVTTPGVPEFASVRVSVLIRLVDAPPLREGSQQRLKDTESILDFHIHGAPR